MNKERKGCSHYVAAKNGFITVDFYDFKGKNIDAVRPKISAVCITWEDLYLIKV